MLQKAKQYWASLPHFVQALIVAFIGGAGSEIGKIAADWPNVCLTSLCLRHDLGLIVGAGVVAARAFYMLPNGTKQIVEQAKAQQQSLAVNP